MHQAPMPDSSSEVLRLRRPGWLLALAPALCATVAILVFGLAQPPTEHDHTFQVSDKTQHFAVFLLVGYCYIRAAKHLYPTKSAIVQRVQAASAAVGLGALLEVLQSRLPYRSAEFLDLVADAAGVGCAVLGASLVDGRSTRDVQ